MRQFVPYDWEEQLALAATSARKQFNYYMGNPDPAMAHTLSLWGSTAAHLPATILVPLASQGITPDSDMGREVIRNSVGATPKGWVHDPTPELITSPDTTAFREQARRTLQANQGDIPTGPPLPHETQLHRGTRTAEQLAPSDVPQELLPQQHHGGGILGGIGHALGGAAGAVGHAASTPFVGAAQGVEQLLNEARHSEQQAGAVAATRAPLVQPQQPTQAAAGVSYDTIKAGSRYVNAAMQAPYEGLQTLLVRGISATSHTSTPVFGEKGSAPIQQPKGNPFDPGQFGLAQMLAGKDSGRGWFEAGEAAKAARTVQARVRGTIGGHVLTPGRLIASRVVEPGTMPYNILSGLTDAAVSWKLDPSAKILTLAGDIRDAQHTFDTYGVASNGIRHFIHGPNAESWVEGQQARKVFQKIADEPSITNLYKATNGKIPVTMLPALAQARDPQTVHDILRPFITGEARDVPSFGYGITRPMSDSRWATLMPHGALDIEDPKNTFEQLNRLMITTNVPQDARDVILTRVTNAMGNKDRAAFYNAVAGKNGAYKQIENWLVSDYKVDPEFAHDLMRWTDTLEKDRPRIVEMAGSVPTPKTIQVGGDAYEIGGPYAWNELLNRSISIPDPRALRHAATNPIIRGALDLPGVKGSRILLNHVTTKVWKPLALARLALTVRLVTDSQMRAASAGYSSVFRHPFDLVAYMLGAADDSSVMKRVLSKVITPKGFIDPEGNDFRDLVKEYGSMFRHATGDMAHPLGSQLPAGYRIAHPFKAFATSMKDVGRGSSGLFGYERSISKHWNWLGQTDPGYREAWADNLSQLHADPPHAMLAHNITTHNDGLARTKDWLWNGEGQQFRKDILSGADDDRNAWMGTLATREGSDAYVETMQHRLGQVTQNDPALLETISHGKWLRDGRINEGLTNKLKTMHAAGVAPKFARGMQPESNIEHYANAWNHGIDWMFAHLIQIPENRITRIPVNEQAQWNYIRDIFPRIEKEGQATVLQSARDANMGKKFIRKMQNAYDNGLHGTTSLASANLASQVHALEVTKTMLHDLTTHSNFMDALRMIAPFGEAWRQIVTKWGGNLIREPQTLRRFEQIIQGAEGAQIPGTPTDHGFFYKDPSDGTEKFVFPGSAWLNKKWAGEAYPLIGSAQGLNIAAEGLPGVGPAIAVAADKVLPQNGMWDEVRHELIPFGAPDVKGGLLEAMLPGWAQRLRTVVAPSPNQQRIKMDTTISVLKSMIAAGEFNPNDPDSYAKAMAVAKGRANRLYMIRSAAQFVTPSAPQFDPQILTKHGKMYELYALTKTYRNIVEKNGGDFSKADQAFIDQFGQRAFYAVVPDSQTQYYMPPTTKQQVWWNESHQSFVHAHPEIAGFFGPTSGDFDYNAYLHAIESGAIKPLSADDWIRNANHRVATWIYGNVRTAAGPTPTQPQRDLLSQFNTKLQKQYPGYDPAGTHGKNISPQNARLQLFEAAGDSHDKAIYNTPVAKAIRTYGEARQIALDQLKGQGYRSFQSDQTEPARAALRFLAQRLISHTPQFQNVWDFLLSNEVDAPEQVTAGQ